MISLGAHSDLALLSALAILVTVVDLCFGYAQAIDQFSSGRYRCA